MSDITIYCGDAERTLAALPESTVQTIITSPPYFNLRDYGSEGQIGVEATTEEYISRLVAVFRAAWRVLHDDGTPWVNIGDCYAGSSKGAVHDPIGAMKYKQGTNRGMIGANVPTGTVPTGCKPKDLIGIPWLLAFALRADGWYLRQDIIWDKPNVMPESVRDRCTKSHEYLFMFAKRSRYYYDCEAIKEPAKYDGRKDIFYKGSTKYTRTGDILNYTASHARWVFRDGVPVRNKRDVWHIPNRGFRGAHFAVFPEALVEPCILAATREKDTVCDPFMKIDY